MTEIIDEAIDEAVGRRSKRWPLLLVALVVGSAVAVWLVQRSRGAGVELDSATSPASEADAGGG